eukprot:TRINITY_DN11366_c0_g2_i1.p1 TRINITY_DN11366_c0_g2~~TRINITY_DN11366_c0_g2_i1.p1  ORF type:complete len:348 (+),score=133.08 TRINITY_DN11366_c0_g2_i1:88-1044(+)
MWGEQPQPPHVQQQRQQQQYQQFPPAGAGQPPRAASPASTSRSPAANRRRAAFGESSTAFYNRQQMLLERRKDEAERERTFKCGAGGGGYAQRRLQLDMHAEAERENSMLQAEQVWQQQRPREEPPAPHAFAGAPQGAHGGNPYQKFYAPPGGGEPDPAQQALPATHLPPRWAPHRHARRFSEEDKNVVKRCVRCVVESPYINNAGEFRARIGFHRGDARRLYDILCRDESDWSRYDSGSNMWFLINNSMHEIITNNVCQEWSRWFGSVSRRRVDELYDRLEGPGKVLQRYNGRIVELNTPRHVLPTGSTFTDTPYAQ